MNLFQIQRDITDVAPDVIFRILDFPFTNTFLMTLLIMVLFVGLSWYALKKFSVFPGTFQTGVEIAYEAMVKLVEDIVGDTSRSRFIFPLIGALFVYIGVANLIGFIPGLTSFTYEGVPLLRIPTTDFNTTFGLALALVVLFLIMALQAWGVWGHLGRYVRIKGVIQGFQKGIGEGFIALVDFFVGLLDIVSEVAKVISLSVRLFGNIYAGEVLAVIILGAFAYGLPTLWMALSILFALVQAVVFGALAVAYYDMAVSTEEAV